MTRLGGDGVVPGFTARVARARVVLALGAAPGPVRKYELQQMTRTEWAVFVAALRDLVEGGMIGETVVAGKGKGTGTTYIMIYSGPGGGPRRSSMSTGILDQPAGTSGSGEHIA